MIVTNFLDYYEREISRRGFIQDRGQSNVIGYLDHAIDSWSKWQKHHDDFFPLFKKSLPTPKGVYIWGGVGRGKTFLMDVFYNFIPVKKKTRIHFYEFMHNVHKEMHILKDQIDPLNIVSKKIADKYNLICFDEFHVSDIADAMILDRLLKGLHGFKVGFILTSNYFPSELYPDGLHRNELLPAIRLINKITQVIKIPNGVDHRRNREDEDFFHLAKNKGNLNSYYQFPLSNDSSMALQRHFNKFMDGNYDQSEKIIINNRPFPFIAKAGGVIWTDFNNLCNEYRSQIDYLLLCRKFHTILVSDVPQLSSEQNSAARRFTWLVDILYDQKIRLIISAQVAPDHLYITGMFADEFKRTVSRIMEMQSETVFDNN